MQTMGRQLAGIFGLVSVVSLGIVLAVVAVWWRENSLSRFIAMEEARVHERGLREMQNLHEVSKYHDAVLDRQVLHATSLEQHEVERLFQLAFERREDGTWRSRDVLFEGPYLPGFGPIHGIGAFIGPETMTAERKRLLVSALLALRDTAGFAASNTDARWFVTTTNDLMVYAPHRADDLMFYRYGAPPSMDFQDAEFMQSIRPDANPDGADVCTDLDHAQWDPSRRLLVASCQRPVIRADGLRGGWGTTLRLNDWIGSIIAESDDQQHIVLASMSGEVMAAPQFDRVGIVDAEVVASVSADYRLRELTSLVRAHGGGSGVIPPRPDDSEVISFVRFGQPDWVILFKTDRSAIQAGLGETIWLILALSLVLIFFQLGLLARMLKHQLIEPLRVMREGYRANRADQALPQLDGNCPLELHDLSHALASAWQENGDLVRDLEGRVEERTRELEAALSAKDVFLANMSHEIRTPLNGVIGLADALAGTALSSQQREILELIRSSGAMLERLLTDVLDISKLEAGRFELCEAEFDLETTIESAARLMRGRADEKGLAFRVEYRSGVNARLCGDDVRIRQIVANLTSNAVKFTQAGEVRLDVSLEGPVDDGASVLLRIVVEDTGIGFDAATAARLFNRFEQADGSLTRRFGGTGLGLAISRALAEAMGGQISATSEQGKGARFEVTLPLKRALPNECASQCQTGAPADDMVLPTAMRALLAEDNATNQKVIQLILEPMGVDLTIVPDGQQAVDSFHRESFDFVLMDMQMPVMDGLTAIRAMRALERDHDRPRTPIAILSANALEEHRHAGLQAGADIHIAKPVTVAAIAEGLQSLLRGEDAADGGSGLAA